MNRRDFLRVSGAGLLTAALGGPVSAGTRPNIVFIIADDLGWNDIGYHNAEIKTPHLDRLASQGVRLGQHYAMPTCTPTRVGFLTGRYPSRFGVLSPAYGEVIPLDAPTLPGILREAGYRTAISGKWHVGSPPDHTPLKYGFDSSYGYFDGQIDPYTHHYKKGNLSWHRNDELLREPGHATDLITDEAVRVIAESDDSPLFVYVAYSVPHFPLDEPDAYCDPYEGVYSENSRRWYAASITHMDKGIGRIVEALERAGKRENTLLVFVSDNGGQQSWHSATEYGGDYKNRPHTRLGDNTPLRDWKGEVYEGGIRVPAFANWPGVLEPGVTDAPAHIVDWLPTFCAVAGCATPESLAADGQNLWPGIRSHADSGARTLYWKTPNAQALRKDGWKLVLRKGHAAELYHIAEDPHEKADVAAANPGKVRELQSALDAVSAADRDRE